MTANSSHAMSLVGTPYRRGGVTPREGFDCFTLLRYVRQHCFGKPTPTGGIPAEDVPSARAAALGIYLALGGKERMGSPWLELTAPEEGCAVALGTWKVSRLHHCGVLVNGGVLHALEGAGVVYSPMLRVRELYARCELFECVL